jgi:hypothetical protein
MAIDVTRKLAQLRTLSRQELLGLWQELYRKAAPQGMRRELLVPFLAYRIQENAYGGLKPSTRAELRRIARNLDRSKGSAEIRARTRIKSGTRLIRRWRGETHEIVVADSGYEYRGTTYRSLSKIACEITGTRWSGPAFFGLNKGTSVAGQSNG